MSNVRILVGDARTVLATLPEQSVQCCVTSPPYYGLRDYGTAGQIGLEATPDAYVAELVSVFRGVRRVLRDDGTLWLNLGDSYNSGSQHNQGRSSGLGIAGRYSEATATAWGGHRAMIVGLKPKDLLGIPWRVAFALQADGWYLRSDIIWSKPNPMPESVTDRPTKAHEYLFLLSKRPMYYYDAEAINEDAIHAGKHVVTNGADGMLPCRDGNRTRDGFKRGITVGPTRNRRSVWTVATQPYKDAHFATFPPELITPCILAGTSQRGHCGKCGAPWERQVEGAKYEPEVVAPGSRRVDESRGDKVRKLDGKSAEWREAAASRVTTGWAASCNCGADPTPAVVLDPFGGAGTTGLVASGHGRSAVLIELNPKYAEMARERIGWQAA